MAAGELVVIVAPPSDAFAAAVVHCLRGKLARVMARVIVCEPKNLVELPIVLDSRRFEVDGAAPCAIVWRVTPPMLLSVGISAEDQAFADAEVVAAWLWALNLPAIYSVNRYPASVWYGGLHWSAWHTWLRAREVYVAALHLGDASANRKQRWIPFHSHTASPVPDATAAAALGIAASAAEPALSVLAVAGDVLHPTPSPTMQAAAAALNASGVVLARLTLDCDDRVLWVDTTPGFDTDEQLSRVAHRVADEIHAHLLAR